MFNPGDHVECISDQFRFLTKGHVYRVLMCYPTEAGHTCLWVRADDNGYTSNVTYPWNNEPAYFGMAALLPVPPVTLDEIEAAQNFIAGLR